MYLGGQAGQRGYAMAALLVSVSIMAIVMSALLPVWKQQARREKEAELAFRGEQWARAIYLYGRKNGGQYPPNLNVLVQGRYIRKNYKDPMTEKGDWQLIFLGQQAGAGGGSGPGGTVAGGAGIAAVQSKSKEASIRIYNGAGFYNQWPLRYNQPGQQGAPGAGRGRGAPGASGGRGRGVGQPSPGPVGGIGLGPGTGRGRGF